MDDDEFKKWAAAAAQRAQAGVKAAAERFGVGTHARYETDLETATIRFLDAKGVEQVRADLQLVGTWSPNSGTWMWGWENESVPEAAVEKLGPIAETGREKDLQALSAHAVECDESDAWTLAALAADIVDAECVYSTGGAKNRVFYLLFNLRKAG
jgi:hypothetical protein